ncbi:type I methionyl aminopeptidase [Moraxella catarrhalis]|uniref:type I methionyl aminopeptidase n=1 Tax=Moraxella TaxID=475 RepID=UPI000202AF25|nr:MULTISPECIES: type I methionyl aminopeptidase [Moraxella]ARE66877.1 type I methionyl aminopeptidase [Moraxella catarrhalis]AXT98846.1 methionine aminopeptidase [Moraxella catarrhalis]EGE22206.1 methionine aminopeptidase, type I [Moraxella catarrhalis BC8]MCG6816782.1 type I methionyl aminopeptidase [Moraxella catarrhalis]MCG6818263.1 type I methionyl aminopeptidase [Moraxella catarrhalis]
MTKHIPILDDVAIDKMKTAGKLAADVLVMLDEHVKTGVSTGVLDDIAHQYILDHGAIPAPLNYNGFPKSICTSINHVVCHGIPDHERLLKEGDIINIDITVIKDGYYGDTSKMWIVGQGSVMAQRLCQVAQKALYAGMKVVKNGAHLGDIGAAIQAVVEPERFSIVREFCGHGIGQTFHTEPQVLHYGKAGTGIELKTGMAFTIEPMINQGVWQTKIMKDGWTAITKDRKLSAQWEHTLIVTDNGCLVTTARPDEDLSFLSS